MRRTENTVHIVGAGPAGLTAAIHLARNDFKVILHEKESDVGTRFNNDFQGLENWSSDDDVHDFLKSIGIRENFLCRPYYGGDFFGPSLEKTVIRTQQPMFYLVERGSREYSLDWGLKQQALNHGVQIRWGDKVDVVPEGTVIVGTGPKAADAIAKGMVFKTSHPDYCAGFVDNRIAPKAYAYLLVHNGRATFATCMFDDFKNERRYFEKAFQTMREVVNLDIVEPREFGGYANFFLKFPPVKNKRILYVGENAGFQDALWGFGLRYAMLSGYLAAASIITGESYDELCQRHIRSELQNGLVNRWLFAHLGNPGYGWILRRLGKIGDVVPVLNRYSHYTFIKKLLFLLARAWFHTRLIDKQCMHVNCGCVWCRHGKGKVHLQFMSGCSTKEPKKLKEFSR